MNQPESDWRYAYFCINGTFDPAEITRIVGITPTDSWKIGDTFPDTGERVHSNVRKFSHWVLKSRFDRFDETVTLEDHIRDVLVQMEVNKAGFAEVVKLAEDRYMECAASIVDSGYPGICLEPDLIAEVAFYGLAIDLDFYIK
jgi:hypothetical protein